jgi:glutathionyl-hydroquinone reductase
MAIDVERQEQLLVEYAELAKNIAAKFSDIPKTTERERVTEAKEALRKAVQSYDPEKGDFKRYATTAIYWKLRTVYNKTVKELEKFVSADADGEGDGPDGFFDKFIDENQDVILEVRRREEGSGNRQRNGNFKTGSSAKRRACHDKTP